MKIAYHGALYDEKKETRLAEVSFDDADAKEVRLADRIIDLMQKTQGWQLAGAFGDCFYVRVDSRAEYDDFKAWYMTVKKMFTNCMKHGF